MASGWGPEGGVQDQIDATVGDAVAIARSRLRKGASLTHCEDCGEAIPEVRRLAVAGASRCVACQAEADEDRVEPHLFNRRAPKGSQLK